MNILQKLRVLHVRNFQPIDLVSLILTIVMPLSHQWLFKIFFQGCRLFQILLLKWSDRVILDRWLTGTVVRGHGEGEGSLLPQTSARSPLPQNKWRLTLRRMSLMRRRMWSGTLYLRVISINLWRRWTLWIPPPLRSRSCVPSRPIPWGLLCGGDL